MKDFSVISVRHLQILMQAAREIRIEDRLISEYQQNATEIGRDCVKPNELSQQKLEKAFAEKGLPIEAIGHVLWRMRFCGKVKGLLSPEEAKKQYGE